MTEQNKQFFEDYKYLWHHPSQCTGQWCVIHNPSPHHMRDWPLVLRVSSLIERICEHGCGHPDPDSLAYFMRVAPNRMMDVHGCDGCCCCPECNGYKWVRPPEVSEYYPCSTCNPHGGPGPVEVKRGQPTVKCLDCGSLLCQCPLIHVDCPNCFESPCGCEPLCTNENVPSMWGKIRRES